MPVYDFLCPDCGALEENLVLTFEEYDAQKALGGLPCEKCPGFMQIKPGRFGLKFGRVAGRGSQTYPGSKRERRQLMEQRYEKRNARLDALPEEQKRRMEKFMDRRGVRKTAPAGPDFV